MPREVKLALELSRLRSILQLNAEQLPDDATDEQINEALAQLPGANQNPDAPAAPQPGEPGGPEPEGSKASGDDDKDDNPPATPPRQVPGGLVVDKGMWEETQRELIQVRRDREERERKDDQEFLSKAVRRGKFPAGRVDHYMTLMKADREGTRQFIDELPEGLPITELGSLGDLDDALKASDYPDSWLTPGERRRVKAAQTAYADGRIGDVEPGSIIREA